MSLTRSSQGLPPWRCLPRGFVVDNRYRVESEVGRGGMASVYRAVGVIDRVNRGEVVAVKVPAPDLMTDEATAQRFLQEIGVSQRLAGHPHIVRTLNYVIFEDPHTRRRLYGLVLEFIDGRPLSDFLAQRKAAQKPLTLTEVLAVLRPVCRALEFAHGQKPAILHRDLKPQNVMVTRDRKLKLMDFGIARVLEESRATLTHQGEIVGTLAYMPPEFHTPDAAPDLRSDVYLAGNLLVELLTFHPKGNAEKHDDCPEAWLDLIGDAMSHLPRKRPATIRDFLSRLEAGLPGKQPASDPPTKDQDQQRIQAADNKLLEEAHERFKNTSGRLQKLLAARRPRKHPFSEERDAIHAAARTLEKQYRYAEAVRKLEELDPKQRDTAYFDSLVKHRDETAALLQEVAAAVHNDQLSFFDRDKILRLKQLDPTRKDLDALLAQLQTELPRFTNSPWGMQFALVPHGTFYMGGTGGKPSSRQVEITHDFYLGIYPVTQGQWEAVMGSYPSHFSRGQWEAVMGSYPSYFSRTGDGKDAVKDVSDADLKLFPVENVSWEDTRTFVAKLNEQEAGTGWQYRLPTEAEWEYSCRGGVTCKKDCSFDFYFEQPSYKLKPNQANFGDALGRPSRVGSYRPNRLGLHDMHGNVWEWCEDEYEAGGSTRVVRGGGFDDDDGGCTAAYRLGPAPSDRSSNYGFCLARVPVGG